jgi:chromate reductase
MPTPRTVAVIVGSLRRASITLKVAKGLVAAAPTHLQCRFVQIGDLPLYNEELEPNPPGAWTSFRNEIMPFDAILFVTPEHNRSVPAALKNAIDVGSRPPGKSIWKSKPAAVVSVSPGQISGFGANHHLRQSLVFLDMPVLQQPEAYINAKDLFDEAGNLAKEDTRVFLAKVMAAFAGWIETTAQPPVRRESAA